MFEQTPNQSLKNAERLFWIRTELPKLLFDIAISALISDPTAAKIAHEELHALDSLPQE